MGDRGNIAIRQTYDAGKHIYLYSHWGGTELPQVLQSALAKRWRWNDEAYLARIIFDQMLEGQHGEETGYGIATSPPDNEHPILTVDCSTQTVTVNGDGRPGESTWTFEEYIALPDPIAAVEPQEEDDDQ